MNTIFNQIKEIIEDEIKPTRGIKAVYYGDPGQIPKSSLPAMLIRPEGGTATALGIGIGGTDDVVQLISIGLVYDQRSEWNRDPEQTTIVKTMMETFFERDDNKNFKSDTLIGAIRKFCTLNEEVLFVDNLSWDFGVNDTREFSTIEGVMTFEAHMRPARPS